MWRTWRYTPRARLTLDWECPRNYDDVPLPRAVPRRSPRTAGGRVPVVDGGRMACMPRPRGAEPGPEDPDPAEEGAPRPADDDDGVRVEGCPILLAPRTVDYKHRIQCL